MADMIERRIREQSGVVADKLLIVSNEDDREAAD
jgi:hypothetical protein